MTTRRICVAVAGWLAATPIVAAAQDPSASVTVRAAAVSDVESAAPTSFVNVIDAQQYANEVETVTDALADSVGVSVRRYGGLGAFSTLSIRGSSSNQVQIYLDGVPLSRAQNETVSLADLPIDALDRMEVYRGTAPVRFGVAGIGGVVNLVTKPASATPATSLSASYGSFTTRKLVATHSRQLGGFDLLAYVTYLGSAGNFRYQTDNDTELDPSDDKEVTRLNNGFDSVDALVKAGRDLRADLRLELTSEMFWKENGLPGRGANQSLQAAAANVRSLNYARLRTTDWLLPRLEMDATLFGIYESSRLRDLSAHGDLGAGRQDRHDQTGSVGGNLAATGYAGARQTLNGFLEVSYDEYDPSNDVVNAPPETGAHRLRTTLAGQDQLGVAANRLLIVPTLRYEHVTDETDGTLQSRGSTTPQLQTDRDLFSPAVGVQLQPVTWLTLRANLGQYQRAPNFNELFANTGTVIGNPELKSEDAINRDIGFVIVPPPLAHAGAARLEYAYFNNDIDDLIVFVQRSAAVFKPENVGKARLRGHELSLRFTALRWFGLDANYTYQAAENRSTINNRRYLGKQLPGRPRNEAYTRLSYTPDWGSLYYEFNFLSGNFLDLINFDAVPSRDIHTFGGTWKVLGPWSVSLQARNVTDNQIQDVAGFPLPGRSFFGSVGAQF